jgi:hypothetical protein
MAVSTPFALSTEGVDGKPALTVTARRQYVSLSAGWDNDKKFSTD